MDRSATANCAANKAYSTLLTIIKSNCVHRNIKIRIYKKTIIKSIICYASKTWTMSKKMKMTFEVSE
jgi:hypothetical protein